VAAPCSEVGAAAPSGCIATWNNETENLNLFVWTDEPHPPARNVTITFRRLAAGEVCR